MSANLSSNYTKISQSHLLVVDDDKTIHPLISTAIDQMVDTITCVTKGEEALSFLQNQKVDAILLDLGLPDTDGMEVLSQLKAHQQWQHIPVIVISGLANVNKMMQCVDMGATDYLTKPINLSILQARLAAALLNKQLDKFFQTTHRAMAESNAKLRAILETAIDVIVMANEQGVIESINPAVETLFGYSQDELIGYRVNKLMPSIEGQEHNDYIARYLQTGERKIIGKGREVVGKRRDGTLFPLSLMVSEIWVEGRRFFTGILRDLSQQKQAEEAYQVLVNQSVQGLAILQNGVYVFVNPAYARIFNYSQEKIMGNSPLEIGPQFFSAEDWLMVVQKYQDVLTGKSMNPFEVRIVHPDNNTTRWIQVDGGMIHYRGEQALQSMVSDVTTRKQSQDALIASLNKMHILYAVARTVMTYKNLPDLLQKVVDKIADFLPANRVWLHIFDLEKKQVEYFVIGGPGKEKHSQKISHSFSKLMEGLIGWVMLHAKPVRATKDMIDKRVSETVRQDRIEWDIGSLIVSPLRHQQQIIGTLSVINCADERDFGREDVKLVEALCNQLSMAIENTKLYKLDKERSYELQQRNEELNAFAGTVAHDLKNPIFSIKGFVHLLLKSPPNIDVTVHTRWIKNIGDIADQMSEIIESLLLLSRLRHTNITRVPVQMANVLTKVAKRLEPVIEEYEAEVVWGDEWYTVWGYAKWLEEVWVNYISNALKYGGHPPRILVGATCQNDHVCYWVEDNGKGIDPHYQADLFKPFTRFSDEPVEGHGLGLSIVQRIVNKLGGNVGVDSTMGQGSRFWFTLLLYDGE